MDRDKSSSEYLVLKALDGDKLVVMCDTDIIPQYKTTLRYLSSKHAKILVSGCVEYTDAIKTSAVFYLHSRPLFLGELVPKLPDFSLERVRNVDLREDNLLGLCDYTALVSVTINGKEISIPCAVLERDSVKRSKQLQSQVWFNYSDIVDYGEKDLDWIFRKLISMDLDPLVVCREKIYDEDAIFMCGLVYEGA